MLVLTRRINERIQIGKDITVTILRVQGRVVKVGIEAPEGVQVLRTELLERPRAAAPSNRPALGDRARRGHAGPVRTSRRNAGRFREDRRRARVIAR
jgi:carbon storage regulator CsrA